MCYLQQALWLRDLRPSSFKRSRSFPLQTKPVLPPFSKITDLLTDRLREKLEILATAARYDVSCSSSGSKRATPEGGFGNTTGMGICHSYTPDGRCVSLLKILLTNHCIFDCAYCISRRSNDIKRAAFTVQEVVDLTIGFYRRNYIEGLFLSSGIFKDSDTTMERLVRIGEKLRDEHKFGGYIHLKAIPGSSPELLERAGRVADRLSVNIEIPSEMSLKHVAPEKNYKEVLEPMAYLRDRIAETKREGAASAKTQLYLGGKGSSTASAKTPAFATTGQTTQLVVGATPETDAQVLRLADGLYKENKLKRVYYSGYIPIATDHRIPEVAKAPLLREHRLYQADWLMRQYEFSLDEILDDDAPNLDEAVDPKLGWALRHPESFPVDVNTAERRDLLRVPGLGHKSCQRILAARRSGTLRIADLKRFGVIWKRAQYFLAVPDHTTRHLTWEPEVLRERLLAPATRKMGEAQMTLF